MITAVDTSVLLDVLGGDAEFGPRSADALRAAIDAGRVVASDIVWAETAAAFPEPEAAATALAGLRVDLVPLGPAAALATGVAWRAYRRRGGRRTRVVADFVVGAHAAAHADRLLTRDRGFYRTYFDGLTIVDPTG